MSTEKPIEWTHESKSRLAVSACGRYFITWAEHPIHGRFYNAWFGTSPRKHLTGTFDKDLAKTVCEQHRRKFQQQSKAA